MADPRDTLTLLLAEIAAAFEPLRDALSSPGAAVAFLRDLGYDVATAPAQLTGLVAGVRDLLDTLGDGLDPADVPVLAGKLRAVVDGVRATGSLAGDLPRDLLERLLADHLLRNHPVPAAVLRLLGILIVQDVPAAPGRIAHQRRALDLALIPALLENAPATIAAALGWGGPTLNSGHLLDAAAVLGSGLGLDTRVMEVPRPLRQALAGTADVAPPYQHLLRATLVDDAAIGGPVHAVLAVSAVPVSPAAGAPPGLAIVPTASGGLGADVPLTETVEAFVEAAVDGGVAIVARPGRDVAIVPVGSGGAPATTVTIGVRGGRDGASSVLIGSDPGSRVEYRSLTVAAGARADTGSQASLFLQVRLEGSAVVIAPAPGDTDSFLGKLLPPDGFRVEFDLEIRLDSRSGLTFAGSAGLEIEHPLHVDLGPLSVQGLTVALRPDGGAVALDVGAALRGQLGPLTAVVQGVGLTVRLDPAAPRRNLGLVDLSLEFRPPDQVGIAIDAGPVTGGGFLSVDHARGEYAGMLELEIAGFIAVRAIGIITTRQPDGTPGFSLLLIMSAEFTPGLQLGFGFSLVGVGGLVGLNRSVRLDELAQGIRTGAADGILFPRDLIANAPRILSDLRAIFPARPGTFLIGPMLKVGWGTPTLISLSLGVIIEIPGNVAILGVLTAALPTSELPVLQLKVSFVGAVEFDTKRVWFFASLFDSRLLTIPIDGEMGLLMAFGDAPDFVVSVGGFHPRFTPPALPFPSPARVGITILATPTVRISASGYVAITTNTVQFGARAELLLGFDGFGLAGHISFDALIRFAPFAFEIQAGASLSLDAFGVGVFSVRVDLTLTGPTPWRARGRGSVCLLFFDISADFDLSWGDALDTGLPPIDVLPAVVAELTAAANWAATPPRGARTLVSLRDRDLDADPDADAGSEVLLHPLGTVRVSQRVVPLGVTLDRVGAQRPGDVRQVTIGAITGGLVRADDAREQFALGQYRDLSDDERLTLKAFESQPSGVVLAAGATYAASRAVHRTIRYELVVVDTLYRRPPARVFVLPAALFGPFLAANAAATSAPSATRAAEKGAGSARVEVAEEDFVVASAVDNSVADGMRFASQAMADEHLRGRLVADPGLADRLHVIPAFEAVGG